MVDSAARKEIYDIFNKHLLDEKGAARTVTAADLDKLTKDLAKCTLRDSATTPPAADGTTAEATPNQRAISAAVRMAGILKDRLQISEKNAVAPEGGDEQVKKMLTAIRSVAEIYNPDHNNDQISKAVTNAQEQTKIALAAEKKSEFGIRAKEFFGNLAVSIPLGIAACIGLAFIPIVGPLLAGFAVSRCPPSQAEPKAL